MTHHLDDICQLCYKRSSTPPKIEEWKENFNNLKSLGVVGGFFDYGDDDCPPEINWDRIEYFISNLVTQTRLSTIEEARGCVPEEMIVMTENFDGIRGHSSLIGFNAARSEMLENLNKMK